MPYKPTGRPAGRPPKDPAKRAKREAELAAKKARKPLSRARRAFREHVERLAPTEAVQIYDSRGRPRHTPSSQRRIA